MLFIQIQFFLSYLRTTVITNKINIDDQEA